MIAGNRTSLPEVVGDAGLLVDPFDEKELAQAMARLIEDSDLAAELRVKGLERAKQFSWHETARLTLKAYEQAAQQR